MPQKNNTRELTEEGKEEAKSLQSVLPNFKIIISSDSSRTQETALLLTGTQPKIDTRAGYFNAPQQISDEINSQAKLNPGGFTAAYLENNDIKEEVTDKAQGLVNLILETLEKLNSEEKALIISHDITMVPAEKLFTKKFDIQSFNYLSGYIISENKDFTPYSL